MAHPSKVKGSRYERDVREWLRGRGYPAERLPLAGVEDEGDIVLPITWDRTDILELKAENRIDLPGYLRELKRERENYAKHRSLDPDHVGGVVVIKRRLANVGQSYVVTTLEEYYPGA